MFNYYIKLISSLIGEVRTKVKLSALIGWTGPLQEEIGLKRGLNVIFKSWE